MVDYRTEDQVRAHAVEFRKKHNALDWSVSVDDMIDLQGYSQDKYGQLSFSRFGSWLKSAVTESAKKVKALVSVKEKVILVSHDLHTRRVPFAKAHEMGHAELPWHKAILYVCDEHDLAASTQEQLEFEANVFASELLLPKDLLEPIYQQFPTSLETVMLLQERSGTSIESAAVAFTRHHPGVCALLTLEEIELEKGVEPVASTPRLKLVRKSLSRAAVKTSLGALKKDQTFPTSHVIFTASRSIGPVTHAGLRLIGADGSHSEADVYKMTIINNSYKVFCLVTTQSQP
jgi:Zn-dependent peptidase ImmA (M78 family)